MPVQTPATYEDLTGGIYTATASGFTSFSAFGVGNDGALPVQMGEFTARPSRRAAELRWRTETEVDNYGFEIERRMVQGSMFQIQGSQTLNVKPETWNLIGFIQGSGTSSSPHEYSYLDKGLPSGRYAYRIKQIDNDGSFAYTSAVEVEVGLAPRVFTLSQNYPNPFNPTTTIEFTLPGDGRVVLKIYDIAGREVATLLDEERKAGVYQQFVFDASRIASGV